MFVIISIIAVSVFFISVLLLKKFRKNKRSINAIAAVITIVLTPLIYLGLIRFFMFSITYEPKRGFSQRKWHSDKTSRYYMAPDIIESKMLIGKDSNQVKAILGEPDIRRPQYSHWEYDMGEGSGGLGFMFHFLRVNIENNKVVSIQHGRVQD